MEVFMQRLEMEHGTSVVTTTPTVRGGARGWKDKGCTQRERDRSGVYIDLRVLLV